MIGGGLERFKSKERDCLTDEVGIFELRFITPVEGKEASYMGVRAGVREAGWRCCAREDLALELRCIGGSLLLAIWRPDAAEEMRLCADLTRAEAGLDEVAACVAGGCDLGDGARQEGGCWASYEGWEILRVRNFSSIVLAAGAGSIYCEAIREVFSGREFGIQRVWLQGDLYKEWNLEIGLEL
ncbi:hypothetical protein Taro_002813 [Colocasia esculenta]|uniref:Uncharacterized protein n=1 Tax=Colocasia esculenta TaxID=4460 RepID=A0A843TK95_COLES|nr:hypothetical protein [Colocasia esculenta]